MTFERIAACTPSTPVHRSDSYPTSLAEGGYTSHPSTPSLSPCYWPSFMLGDAVGAEWNAPETLPFDPRGVDSRGRARRGGHHHQLNYGRTPGIREPQERRGMVDEVFPPRTQFQYSSQLAASSKTSSNYKFVSNSDQDLYLL